MSNQPSPFRDDAIRLASRPQGLTTRELQADTGMEWTAAMCLVRRMTREGKLVGMPGRKASCRHFSTLELAAAYEATIGDTKRRKRNVGRSRPAPFREELLQWLKATPEGVTAYEICEKYNKTIHNVCKVIQILVDSHQINGYRDPLDYASKRKRWFAIEHYKEPPPVQMTGRIRGSSARVEKSDPMASFKAQPAVIPKGLQVIVCPATRCDERWAVTLPPGGGVITQDWRESRLARHA